MSGECHARYTRRRAARRHAAMRAARARVAAAMSPYAPCCHLFILCFYLRMLRALPLQRARAAPAAISRQHTPYAQHAATPHALSPRSRHAPRQRAAPRASAARRVAAPPRHARTPAPYAPYAAPRHNATALCAYARCAAPRYAMRCCHTRKEHIHLCHTPPSMRALITARRRYASAATLSYAHAP